MKTQGFIFILLASLGTITRAQTVTGEPAGIPRVPEVYQREPWEDPQITSINRDRSRATAYSYKSVEDALSADFGFDTFDLPRELSAREGEIEMCDPLEIRSESRGLAGYCCRQLSKDAKNFAFDGQFRLTMAVIEIDHVVRLDEEGRSGS